MTSSLVFHTMNPLKLRGIIKRLYLSSSTRKIATNPSYSDGKNHVSSNNKRLELKFLEYLEVNEPGNSNKALQIQRINDNLMKSNYFDDLCKKYSDKQFIKSVLQETDYSKLKNSLVDIDLQFCNIANELSTLEIFECLAILLRIDPSKIIHTNFYAESIEILKTALKRDQLSPRETLKLLLFAGLRKKEGAYNVKFIIKCLPPFNKLSLIEQSILADTLFKCSIKFKKIQGRFIEEIIDKNAELLVKEMYWLVPLCKAVRYIGPSKKFKMKNLSQALINAENRFGLSFSAHIVSLYAEAYLKEMKVLSRLFDDAFVSITPENPRIRVKDIDRLLWSARILNYQLKESEINEIETFIHQRFKMLAAVNALLINILLSLWMFGHKSEAIIEKCFERKLFQSIFKDESQWKPLARLQLLLTCIRLEAPQIQIPQVLQKPHHVGLKITRNVRKIFKQIDALKDDLHLQEIQINCPVDGIYIPGVSAIYRKSRNLHIDVLDEKTCLRDSHEPHGLMNLKLRLLKKIEYQSILVTEEYVDNDEALRNYLSKIMN